MPFVVLGPENPGQRRPEEYGAHTDAGEMRVDQTAPTAVRDYTGSPRIVSQPRSDGAVSVTAQTEDPGMALDTSLVELDRAQCQLPLPLP